VWAARTDPHLVKQWWGPEQFGGHHSYSTWNYTNIDPFKRIAFIHNLADPEGNKLNPVSVGMPADFPQDQLQTVDFKELGDGRTEVTVTEYGWPEGQMMKFSKMGMEQCLNKMAIALGQ